MDTSSQTIQYLINVWRYVCRTYLQNTYSHRRFHSRHASSLVALSSTTNMSRSIMQNTEWDAAQIHRRLHIGTAIRRLDVAARFISTQTFPCSSTMTSDRSKAITEELLNMFSGLSPLESRLYREVALECTRRKISSQGG